MKVYTLTIVYDENDDTIEYIEEEVTEDVSTVVYDVEIDPEYFDTDTIKRLIKRGIIAES
jgi:hypothetical protein|tara:strand:+ start:1247 stop:1426 length:180 start_codon:yes stop_codon:yes gene_type:complete